MKTIITKISILALIVFLTACNHDTTEGVDTTEVSTSVDGFPTCTIKERVPRTDNQLTVQINCTGGSIDINEATVSTDGQVKTIEYEGQSINDYIGFKNLEENTNYIIKFEIVVNGQTLTDSITIKTKKSTLRTDGNLATLLPGTTQYTVNTQKATSDKVFSQNGTFTSAIVLPNGTPKNATGTYTIKNNVITLTRASGTIIIATYLSHQTDIDLITLSASLNGGTAFETYWYLDAQSRDTKASTIP